MAGQGVLRDAALKNHSFPSYLSLPQLGSLSFSSIMSSFMPSLPEIFKAALAFSQYALHYSSNTVTGGCSNPQTSCQNTTAVANTCCFNAPGGQLLQVCQHVPDLYTPTTADYVATDSILGCPPFYWTDRFMDHSRLMVGSTTPFPCTRSNLK